MRKIIAAIVMTGLVGHAFAQNQPQADQDQNKKGAAAVPCTAGGAGSRQDDQQQNNEDDRRRGGAVLMPCEGAAGASAAAVGNLTPLYIGAGVVGAAVIAGAMSGDGHSHNDRPPAGGGGGTGGTGGTTGTTGTH